MHRLFAATLILLTTAAVTFGQTDQRPGSLNVGSWNIESIDSGSGQNVRIMAAHLDLLRLDILALNHVDGNAGRRNQQLDAIFQKANENEEVDWQYRLFANKSEPDRTQLVGVAWNNNRVSLDDDLFRIVTDDGASWRKPPHAAKFSAGSGRTDIVLIPVQLEPKSRESDCLAGTRGEQAQALAGLIQRVRTHFADDDIVVIGDTECIRDDTETLTAFEAERSLDLKAGDVVAFTSGQSPYNRVMVPALQPEFTSTRSYTVIEAEGPSRDTVMSDHFVLLAPIRVMADDD